MIKENFMNTNDKFKIVEAMLYNYKNILAEIKILSRDLEILENDYRGTGAISYEEKTGKTNAFSSEVENEVIKRVEKIQRLKNKIRLKEIEIEKIDAVLEALNENDEFLIKEYYMNNKQLKFISSEIGLAESYASAYKSNLINKIINIIFNEESS